MKIAKLILGSILLTLWVATGWAQAPANAVLVGAEGITIQSTTGTAVAFKFGAGLKMNTVANPKYPLVVSCVSVAPCALLGGDPDPGVAKSIYALEQSAAYTVTLSTGAVIQVPALPVVSTTYTITCTTAPLPDPLPATTTATCTITVVAP